MTIREDRAANGLRPHRIPVGILVEHEEGFRLFVVAHKRDCDGSPLYWLSHDADDVLQKDPHFANDKWVGGFSEYRLRVVRRRRRGG